MSFDRTMLAMPERRVTTPALPVAPTDFRKPVITGLTVIGLAFGGLGTWAALAPLDSAVVAQGVVSVESRRKTVQHREGGIVAEVLAKEGQTVEAGAVLVRLEDSSAQAGMATLEASRAAKMAEQARLTAELDGAPALRFPETLLARRADPVVAEILAREQDRFAERAKSMDGQIGILEQRISQLDTQRDGKQGLETSKRRQLSLLSDEIAGLRRLEAKGFYPRNKLRASERELARLQGEMLADNSGATQIDKEIGETRMQILQLDQKRREEVSAELAKVEAELNDVGARLVAAHDAVDRLAVVAPFAGRIQSLKVAGPGAVVHPGGEVAEIVPDDDRLVVEAQVRPTDVDSVTDGQEAELRFSALSSRTTPVVKGSVEVVSPDRITDPATRQAYYLARVEVDRTELARLGQPIKTGMPVEVMMKVGERTPLQYLLQPLLDSFARGFKEV